MANMDLQEPRQSMNTTPTPQVPTPFTSPMPLQLSGSLSGDRDTIQVQGDTGDFLFSVQLRIKNKLFPEKVVPPDSPSKFAHTPEKFSVEDSSFSSYVTPIASEELEDQTQSRFAEEVLDESCRLAEEGDGDENMKNIRECVVTRLRSGVISPVRYFPKISLSKLMSCEKVKSRKKRKEKIDVFEKLLRRHSCPVKPCTSYALFVMATWGVLKSSSFGETSKRIGQMWWKLSHNEKKLYEEMALKDNARYKRQCKLFRSKAA